MAELDINRDISLKSVLELNKYGWIDRQTRAVFVEFTLFNPNTEQFSFLTLLAEFPSSGGVLHFTSIKNFRTYSLGFLSIYLYFCSGMIVMYFIFHIIFAIKAMRGMGKKYFASFKGWVDITLFALICFWLSAYIALNAETSLTMAAFSKDKTKYTHFGLLAWAYEMYTYSVALLNGLGMLKLITLLNINRRIYTLAIVLRRGTPQILGVGLDIGLALMAYGSLGYLFYGPNLSGYRSFLVTLASLMRMSLGDYDLDGMLRQGEEVTSFFFFTFVVLINLILSSLLVSAILYYQGEVQRAPRPHADHELLRELLGQTWRTLRAATSSTDKK